jgi:aspartate/methionine/tyrosine aminotransferase
VALCTAPFLLDRPDVEQIFPKDAIARARKLLAAFKGGVGAYTDSRGNPLVREEIAQFIAARDGHPSNPEVSCIPSSDALVTISVWCAHCTCRCAGLAAI